MREEALVLRAPDDEVRRVEADSDEELVRLWLHGKSVHSVRAYSRDVGCLRAYVGKPLVQVMLRDLQGFADQLGGKSASQVRTLAAVKSLFAFGYKLGYFRFNVGAALIVPNAKDGLSQRILRAEEVVRMIALEDKPRSRAILKFLYETGCRVSELCSLEWGDLAPLEGGGAGSGAVATVFGKGGKTRHIRLSGNLWEVLLGGSREGGSGGREAPVFPSRTGRHLEQTAVFRVLERAARRAGFAGRGISPHWLRHACASHALDRGAPVSLVKEQLGHASLETTSRYVHARPESGLFEYLER